MINFGIRQSFDKIEQIEERYSNIKEPVEIAFPYYWDIYEPIRGHLLEIAGKIKSYQTKVLSIHAVQAPITDEIFKVWGREIADFAKLLGVKTVTLHPNNINKDKALQERTLENLRYLSDLYQDEIAFCIETFEGSRRVFAPDEIIKFNLPMTLDTAHISDEKTVWNLLKGYKQNIKNIHLSAKDGDRRHLPIDSFCREVISYLIETKWDGTVILEYLFEFHERMLDDLRSLESKFQRKYLPEI
ncbi:MAG: sugar phosphate isomerase/epimerase [Actinobacteria bacterium]|nr:sugar phosphate isomerase/epimerase [Actinomycetota bacterium]MCL5985962.1 sugar phosphate isomerase/epimerase [Actinomycetota bacterium]